ncbi:MAG: XRE family transcriptional regulator [Polyangiaceae bacterium]|nr:XRE family transcriptional regulator [Polyangiaceae bacterium]
MTRAAGSERISINADEFDLSRARLVRRGPRREARLPLRALRAAVAQTQLEVAAATGISQGDVSKLEQRESLDGFEVATLRRYVEALGGKLELVASFPKGHKVALAGADKKR